VQPPHPSKSATVTVTVTAVGRLSSASESLFYYDVADGFDFDYYNDAQDYTPQFDIESSASAQQREHARRLCTINGQPNSACVYDYLATGNEEAAVAGAYVYSNYTAAWEALGLFDHTIVSASTHLYTCSVLFFSRPRSEGWPHHGRTFSIYPCPLSF